MPLGIFCIILVVALIVIVYGILLLDVFDDLRILPLALVGVLAILLFMSVFPYYMEPTEELEQYEIVEANLGMSGRHGNTAYAISYIDKNKIETMKVTTIILTDQPTHLSYCKTKYGFLIGNKYIYYLNKEEIE